MDIDMDAWPQNSDFSNFLKMLACVLSPGSQGFFAVGREA